MDNARSSAKSRLFWISAGAALLLLPGGSARAAMRPGPEDESVNWTVVETVDQNFSEGAPVREIRKAVAPPADFRGIHQIQQEEQRKPAPKAKPKTGPIGGRTATVSARPKTVPRSAATLAKKVVGWHPYWMGTAYEGYDYSKLSAVAFFSYEVNSTNGSYDTLHGWDTTPLVSWAHANNVKAVLTATLFGSAAVQRLLTNAVASQNLIDTLATVVPNRGGDGVNIDFESVGATSRTYLTAFMSNLAVRFHRDLPGSEVSIALPAIDWNAAFDVAAYDGFLDYALVMGYDYHWSTSADAGPVAPLAGSAQWGQTLNVRYSVTNYLAKGIRPGKLLLACPYYGYDWPAANATPGAATLGAGTAKLYSSAVTNAFLYGRNWNAAGSVPYYVYTNTSAVVHQCWYDDAESLALKYDLVNDQGIGGIGIWALGYDGARSELWDLIGAKFAASAPGSADGAATTAAAQPAGGLEDIVVFTSAGHGFAYNTNYAAWMTGRELTNGVVEDFGNVDQLNYFADYCFKAGATVVPMRPLGQQTNEVVLDNADAGVTFGGTWSNSTSTTYYGAAGATPYRYAYVNATGTTAWAIYRPTIPAAGFYPVYAWARSGSDRVRQLYRVYHSGGVTDVRVNHRRVGLGWVWLGTYYFAAGTDGSVNVSNFAPGGYLSTDVVIADAIRFGNGMGDSDRGGGVSGFERELEAARYWVQAMVGQGMSSTLYDSPSLSDSDDNVGAPNRMAVEMNREADGGFWDRIYLGFHSNAGSGSGRGPMGLYDTRYSSPYLARQQDYALLVAKELTNDLGYGQNGVWFLDAFSNNTANLYGSTYGEIYGAISNEMNATIIEVGYHDSPLDAYLLKCPGARRVMAMAAYQGVVKHLCTNNSSVSPVLLPDPPTHVGATNAGVGSVAVTWRAPAVNAAGGSAAAGYVVYRSTNGYGFGNPVFLSGAASTALTLTNLAVGQTYYFQVCATNAGGESLPSKTVGVRVSPAGFAPNLFVNGFERNERRLSPARYVGNNVAGDVTRVIQRRINAQDYVVPHAAALAAAGRYFDSCDSAAVAAGDVDLTGYFAAYWELGRESTANETFSAAEQSLVSAFLSAGNRLFVSGTELAWDLDSQGASADKTFCSNVLKTAYGADDAGTGQVAAAATGIFSGLGAFAFDYAGTGAVYRAAYPDVLKAAGSPPSATGLVYGASSSGPNAAGLVFSNAYRLVVLGFPFETIYDAATRTSLMARVVSFFGDAPADAPAVDILTPDQSLPAGTTSLLVAGTNNAAVAGTMFWSNRTTGAGGAFAAAPAWTTAVSVASGVNTVLVSGVNYLLSQTAVDTVRVTVASASLPDAPAAVWASATNATRFTAAWSAAAGATGYRLDVGLNPTFATGGSATLLDEDFVDLSDWINAGTSADSDATHCGAAPPCRALGANDVLTSPAVDYPAQLSFHVDASSGAHNKTTTNYYSLDGGSTWSPLGTFTTPTNGATVVQALTAAPNLSSSANVRFRFVSAYNTWYLDDVLITGIDSSTPQFVPGFSNRTVAGTSQFVTGLAADATYCFRVRAVNGSGTGTYSSVASVATAANQGISALSIAGNDVQVTFGPVDSGATYALLYRPSLTAGSWSVVASVSGPAAALATLTHAGGGAQDLGYYRIDGLSGPAGLIWGFVKAAKPGNAKLSMVGIPFVTSNQTLNSLMDPLQFSGHHLSPGSADQLMAWNPVTQSYLNLALYDVRSFGLQYAYLTGWKAYTNFTSGAPYVNPVLPAGSAVWIRGSTADDRKVAIAGEVVAAAAATNDITQGLQMVANPFSETVCLSNLNIQAHGTGHYLSPGSADQIMVWNSGSQTYLNLALYDVASYYGSQYAYLTGWKAYTNFTSGAPYVNPQFKPGQGFWYKAVSNDFEWVETNKYLGALE